MELYHIKLHNGQDLVGTVEFGEHEEVRVSNVFEIVSDAKYGMYTKNWLYLSEKNETFIKYEDTLFINKASPAAVEMYVDVLERRMNEVLEKAYGEVNYTLH